jgi:hypothetical protein
VTDVSVAQTSAAPARNDNIRKLIAIVVMTALADWLLYDHPVGISLVLAVLLLSAAVVLTRARRCHGQILRAAIILLIALLPFVEAPGIIAFAFLAGGTAYFALAAGIGVSGNIYARLRSSGLLLLAGPFQVFVNIHRAHEALIRRGLTRSAANALVAWTVPLIFAAIFLALFALANPVIEEWLAALNVRDAPSHIAPARVIFWLTSIALIWPFICVSRTYHARILAQLQPAVELPAATIPERLFGDAVILRSLILFNLLFAVQTILDIGYLWAGFALPHGMSYAQYAHRGAYPLIITTLLAAAFVIVAMSPGSSAERSPPIRALVLLWIGQSVMLVISSILRLDLYVATYSLTYLRAASFVWMPLVMVGLVLIVTRIVLYRPNSWLVSMNFAVLAATVYACGFTNFASIVATYNVAHSRDVSSTGAPLDLDYLVSLGPQAIAAVDAVIDHQPPGAARQLVMARRGAMAASHLNEMMDWRAWSFRGYRLKRYLETGPAAPPLPH